MSSTAARHRLGHEVEDLVLTGEGALHVELGELELAVGTQILVTQAAGDLEVPVDAAHHAQLLVELRRLRQCVEVAGVEAGRDDEVAGALGRGGDQHRRLDLDEAVGDERASDGGVHDRAHLEVALQAFAAQVDVAVAETDGLVDVGALVDGERRGVGRREDLDGAVLQLDLSGGELGVDRALDAVLDRAGDAQHILVAQVVGLLDDALGDAGAVAQVDECEVLAVLSAALDPAAQGDLVSDVAGAQLAAPVRAQTRGGSGGEDLGHVGLRFMRLGARRGGCGGARPGRGGAASADRCHPVGRGG